MRCITPPARRVGALGALVSVVATLAAATPTTDAAVGARHVERSVYADAAFTGMHVGRCLVSHRSSRRVYATRHVHHAPYWGPRRRHDSWGPGVSGGRPIIISKHSVTVVYDRRYRYSAPRSRFVLVEPPAVSLRYRRADGLNRSDRDYLAWQRGVLASGTEARRGRHTATAPREAAAAPPARPPVSLDRSTDGAVRVNGPVPVRPGAAAYNLQQELTRQRLEALRNLRTPVRPEEASDR